MNKNTRKELGELRDKLSGIRSQLVPIIIAQQSILDNVPENLQSSSRCERQEEAVDALDEAASDLESTIRNIDEAINA